VIGLLAGVAVAFADSSIVVLALPDLLRRFDVSIPAVAWTITAYNLVLAVSALVLVRAARRLDAGRLAWSGSLLFLIASVACGLAWGLWPLVAFRSGQGLGAALLLVGSLPLLRACATTPARGTALWAGAGVFGAALGPAAGGLLTQLLSWHAIFFAQAPIAALAFAAARLVHMSTTGETSEEDAGAASRPVRLAANAGLALTSAALVGVLFLAVVLLVDVWRLSPLEAAAVVSAIPIATLGAQQLATRLGSSATVVGAVLLSGGLGGMAFLPARSVAWVAVSLSISGVGLGLLVPGLTGIALTGHRLSAAGGAATIWVRHAGLVVGLLVLTPVLSGDLGRAGDKAKLEGIATVLDAPAKAATKLQLAVDLAPALSRPTSQGLPDFADELEPDHDPARTAIGHELDSVVQATVTRGFRRSFVVATLIALLAVLPAFALPASRANPRRALRAAAAASLAAVALIGAELARGSLSFGEKPRLLGPCEDRPSPRAGADGVGQRSVLAALDEIACRLHRPREQVVADLATTGVSGARLVDQLERYAKRGLDLPGLLRGLFKSS